MIGSYDRTDEPGNLRQIPGGDVGEEVGGKLWAKGVLVEDGSGVLKIFEIGQDVVRENAVGDGLVRSGVDLPGNAVGLELLGHGRVGETAVKGTAISDETLQDGAAARASGIEGSGHGVEAIGIGRAEDGTEIAVADGEGVGEGVVKGKIGTSVIAHREHGVIRVDGNVGSDETVHGAVVPALVLWNPIVRNVVSTGGVGCGSVEMKRKQRSDGSDGGVGRIRLLEGRAFVRKAANAAVASEIVVEGTIFLDKDDDVLDIGKFGTGGTARRRRRNVDGACAAAVESKRGEFGSSGGGAKFEQFATVHGRVCNAS